MKRILLAGLCMWLSIFGGVAMAADFTLPPVLRQPDRLSAMGRVHVSEFRLSGNTVFSREDLAPILSEYENRQITAEELHELRNRLTRFYVDAGYRTSGVVIPDQTVKDGVIDLTVVEGKLTEINVTSDGRLRDRYIKSRIDPGGRERRGPLNVIRMQEGLKILKQDARVDNVNATLKPGLRQGEATLDVAVDDARPYYLTLGFNNHNSPPIGAYRGYVAAGFTNITGWGDSLEAEYGITEGMDDYMARYTVPVTRWDTTLSLRWERSESVVVSEPFGELNIKSETDTWAATLRHPFYRTVSSEFAVALSFENRKGETSLLGDGFSFSDGVPQDGESQISVLRFSQEWVDRSLTQVLAVRSTLSLGIDALGATVDDPSVELAARGREVADGRFFTWLGQFQWLRRLEFLNSQLLLRADLRIADDPVLPMEKFSIGGANTVRGYRENQVTADNGMIGSLEWRVPIFQLKVPIVSRRPTDGQVELCPFIDGGHGWDNDDEDPPNRTLYSIGAGLRWSISDDVFTRVYWGRGLKDVQYPGEYDLQDDGFHFEISARFL